MEPGREIEQPAAPVPLWRLRIRVLAIALVVVGVVILGFHYWSAPEPLADGSTHSATLSWVPSLCTTASSTEDYNGEVDLAGGRYRWQTMDAVPDGWRGIHVKGQLHIITDHAIPSATFSAGGVTIKMVGGTSSPGNALIGCAAASDGSNPG